MENMKLNGIHHITCITEDARDNVDFYVSVLGLRLVKKTINFDVPDAYHLYYADEAGSSGSILTFFEYPRSRPGRAGAGMIHRILWRVSGATALEYWSDRLRSHGIEASPRDDALLFVDPEGLGLGLVVDRSGDRALAADSDVPEGNRLLGFEGVRAYSADPSSSEELLAKTLGFSPLGGNDFVLQGDDRRAGYRYDPAPGEAGVQGAGTVHHIAWACRPDDHAGWQERALAAGMDVTEIIDRKYFRSIYFREPSGVLFEIATVGPGFTVDEPLDRLGETLSLPEWHEDRRARLEERLTPITNPRSRG
jgi:glyoxalase family protein